MALLTRLLLDQGLVDYNGVEEAIKAQVIYGGRIGTNLVELGLITDEQLCKVLEKCYGVPSVLLDATMIDGEAIRAVPEKYIRPHKIFPFSKKRMALGLAMVDPSHRKIIADISFSTGLIVKPFVMPDHRMDQLREQYFDIPIPWRYTEGYEEEVTAADFSELLNKPIEPLTRDVAIANIESAVIGKEIPHSILGYAREFFQRSLLFAVRGNELIALEGFSPPRKPGFAGGYKVQLDAPSVLNDVVASGTVFRGPLVEREIEEDVVDFLGGGMPNTAFAAPITLRGRVVNVLYGDAGPNRNVQGDLGELTLFLSHAAQAYERIIKQRVEKSLKEKNDV